MVFPYQNAIFWFSSCPLGRGSHRQIRIDATEMRKFDATKRHLREAATVEFVQYGITGGRVDRIAANAQCNRQAIYAYFERKDWLFEAVYDRMVVATIQSVPIDANGLPTYDAHLFEALLCTHLDALTQRPAELETSASADETLLSWFRDLVAFTQSYRGVVAMMAAAHTNPDSALYASCAAVHSAGARLLLRAQGEGAARATI